jgi:DNA-binding NarL/FixJ family response regulator
MPLSGAAEPRKARRRFAAEAWVRYGEPTLPWGNEGRWRAGFFPLGPIHPLLGVVIRARFFIEKNAKRDILQKHAKNGKAKPAGGQRLRCVVVEDEAMFRDLAAGMLQAQNLIEVVARAGTAGAGIAACREHLPDLLMLDLALPDGVGFSVARALAKLRPEARTIIVSGEAATFRCPPAMRPFVFSVVHKSQAFDTLRGEIEKLHGIFFGRGKAGTPGLDSLSPRECEVVGWLGCGASTKEIASAMGISTQTVEGHRKRIATKLGMSASRLVSWATVQNLSSNFSGRKAI